MVFWKHDSPLTVIVQPTPELSLVSGMQSPAASQPLQRAHVDLQQTFPAPWALVSQNPLAHWLEPVHRPPSAVEPPELVVVVVLLAVVLLVVVLVVVPVLVLLLLEVTALVPPPVPIPPP